MIFIHVSLFIKLPEGVREAVLDRRVVFLVVVPLPGRGHPDLRFSTAKVAKS